MPENAPATVKLQRRTFYAIVAGLIAMGGGVFSSAAYAAGVHSFDLLAMLFAMGASVALLTLLMWYIVQLRASESRPSP
jgi:FtsH-binding integral membrane protein